MKQVLLLIALLIGINTFGQTYKVNSQGELEQVKAIKVKDTLTKYKVTKKGVQYPVYKSPRSKYYIIRVSKNTGKEYKQYITIED